MNSGLLATSLAAVVCLSAASGARAQVVISIDGECPGRMALRWEGATPDRWAVLWFSQSLGNFTLYAGVCEGTVLGLGSQGLRIAKLFRTGADGRGTLVGRTTSHACGGYLQVMENGSPPCPLSNVVQIPQ